MKRKAIFLLTIFLLNTLAGFSCALHFDHNSHGNNHSHAKSASHHQSNSQHSAYQIMHDVKPAADLGFVNENLCCKTLAGNLTVQGKLSTDNNKGLIKAPVLLMVSYFSQAPLVAVNNLNVSYARLIDQHLPDRDIRIAIRSFQI